MTDCNNWFLNRYVGLQKKGKSLPFVCPDWMYESDVMGMREQLVAEDWITEVSQ